jgi:hypothetical protein
MYARQRSMTYQFAVQATGIAIQFVVQPSPPQWGVRGAAVRTFCLHTTRRRVVVVVAPTSTISASSSASVILELDLAEVAEVRRSRVYVFVAIKGEPLAGRSS